MSFIKKIFSPKDAPIQSYADFWKWFEKHEKTFYKVVKQHDNIERDFFDKISPKLSELKDGFFYTTGMVEDNTAELIITVDGNIKDIVFAEELVQAAPKLNGWLFTALKPAMADNGFSIQMYGHSFNKDNISFYSNNHPDLPDEIDLTFVHPDLTEENKSELGTAIYIFLDNLIGELNFATLIDTIALASPAEVQEELIPVEKLKDFLVWREKEFVEKYEGVRHDTENDEYSMYEAELEDGNALIAVVNAALLEWDCKASHPWILSIAIKYNGEDNRGMPDSETMKLLEKIEEEVLAELKDADGYLNIGRETANSTRDIYFACNEFRKPSKVLYQIQRKYESQLEISYEIYKDKYWQSFNRFK